MKHLGPNIRQARIVAGITQLALAHAIGNEGTDAGAYISRIESGQQEPRLDTLSRIAQALKVPLDSLLAKQAKAKLNPKALTKARKR